jgi:hypothetical protein
MTDQKPFHTVDDAYGYMLRMLNAYQHDDKQAFELAYVEALATSDPDRPMFRIVNMLIAELINAADGGVQLDDIAAYRLIRDALKDVPDPWVTPDN